MFRPTASANVWAIDNTQVVNDIGSELTVSITGVTTSQASTVTLAIWMIVDDNTWTNLTGTGWVHTGEAQYTNISGEDQGATFAHKIQSTAGATGIKN